MSTIDTCVTVSLDAAAIDDAAQVATVKAAVDQATFAVAASIDRIVAEALSDALAGQDLAELIQKHLDSADLDGLVENAVTEAVENQIDTIVDNAEYQIESTLEGKVADLIDTTIDSVLDSEDRQIKERVADAITEAVADTELTISVA